MFFLLLNCRDGGFREERKFIFKGFWVALKKIWYKYVHLVQDLLFVLC